MGEETTEELKRDLGLFAVFTTASGTMIGAGIFVLPGPAAAGAGPAAALSFAIAGLIALIATTCAVELATAMPRAGGPYFFASRAMGPLVGTVIGLGSWLALIFKGSFALVGLGQYVRYFSPVPIVAVAAVAGLLLVAINWIGAKQSGKLQNAVVVGLVVILGVFAGRGLFAIDAAHLTPFVDRGWRGVVTTTGLVFISYLGIVKATAVAEEVEDPGTTLPRGLVAAVLFVTGLYIATMLIITGVMPIDAIVASTAPVADAGELFLGAVGGVLIAVAGILATVSTANAAILASSRFPFAMARDGLVPPKLRYSSPRFGTPTRSIWLTGLVMIGLTLFFDVEGLAKLGGTFGILVFALLNVTVVLLRNAQPEWYEPEFRAPLSPALPLLGAAAALLLIPGMGTLSQVSAIVFVLVGAAWYYLQTRIGDPVQPEYGLGDQLRRVTYTRALAEKARGQVATAERRTTGGESRETPESRITVEVSPRSPNREILLVTAAFASRFEAVLDVVVVSEVPPQIPLSEYDHGVDDEWFEALEADLEASDRPADVHHLLVRDRTDALVDRITDRTELLLVDWDDPIRKHHLRESHVDEMIRLDLPVRVAVLKQRGGTDLEEIVVATGNEPYARAEVELADAIATATGATLTLVKVIPEDAAAETVDTAREYLEELTTIVENPAATELVQHDSVAEALIRRGELVDLLVIGAPTKPDRLHDVFGQTADVVAAESRSSVLVVREPRSEVSWSRRLWQRIFGP